jgi:CoA:oxalate CoA-transferase
LRIINPRIVYCSISGFGHDTLAEYASKPAYDMVAQGYSGLMSVTGPMGGEPVRVGTSVGDIVAGHQGAIGVLAALNYRDRTGEGQHVDISMVDGLVSILENAVVRYSVSGEVAKPLGTAHPAITPFQGFKTKDDTWIITPVGNDIMWEKYCKAIGRDDLAGHDLYKTNELRTKNRDSLIAILEQEMLRKTSAEWIKIFDALGLPNSPLNTVDRVVDDPNLQYREMMVDVDQPGIGELKVAGSPYRMSKTPGAVRTHAPRLGEHSEEVLREFLGFDDPTIAELIASQVVMSAPRA